MQIKLFAIDKIHPKSLQKTTANKIKITAEQAHVCLASNLFVIIKFTFLLRISFSSFIGS